MISILEGTSIVKQRESAQLNVLSVSDHLPETNVHLEKMQAIATVLPTWLIAMAWSVSSRCQYLNWLNQLWLDVCCDQSLKTSCPTVRIEGVTYKGSCACQGRRQVINNTSDCGSCQGKGKGPDVVGNAYNPSNCELEAGIKGQPLVHETVPYQKERKGLTKQVLYHLQIFHIHSLIWPHNNPVR